MLKRIDMKQNHSIPSIINLHCYFMKIKKVTQVMSDMDKFTKLHVHVSFMFIQE